MISKVVVDKKIAEALVLDELFDLELYRRLEKISTGGTKAMFAKLIPVEESHLHFWQNFFNIQKSELNFSRRIKLFFLLGACSVLGEKAVHLVMDAIEIYGIRKYLSLWNSHKHDDLGIALKKIIEDELGHEDEIVSTLTKKSISPERVRNIFLGFNDGLVEITGAISGFFAAFQDGAMVLIASATVAIAGAFSMAAGTYAAVSSEQEIGLIENEKKEFFGAATKRYLSEHPVRSGIVVGISYLFGSLIPVLPVLFGANWLVLSLAASAFAMLIVSWVLAFLSGMDAKKRIVKNLFIVFLAIAITYGVGAVARNQWGITI